MLLFSSLLQAENAIDLFYKLKVEKNLQECNIDGETTGFSRKVIPEGSKFTIIEKTENGNIVRFWLWPVNKDASGNFVNKRNEVVSETILNDVESKEYKYSNFNFNSETGSYRYFLISDEDLKNFAMKLEPRFSPVIGTVVLPLKLRQNGDFTKDVSLSGMGGIKWNLAPQSKFSIDGLLGVGIASVSLDSTNVTDATDRPALSFQAGIVLHWHMLQLGVFVGADRLPKRSVDNWEYNKKPWLGFGIGVSLFTNENSKEKEQDN